MSELFENIEKLDHYVKEIASSHIDFESLLEESISRVSKPPARASLLTKGVIELDDGQKYVFIGDLHGDYYTILGLLSKAWDLIKDSTIIFLGDYIDRGLFQVETLTLVLLLKIHLENQVVLLRGNHEPPRWLIPYPHDYIDHLEKRFVDKAEKIYEESLELFNALPIAIFKRDHFVALHGGPPLRVLRSNSIDSVFTASELTIDESNEILVEVLWSDPGEIEVDFLPSPRGAGFIYGPSITRRMLKLVNGKILIRGHEAVNGFKTNHDGLVLTVFTSPLVYGFRCGGLLVYEVMGLNEAKASKLCYEPSSKRLLILNSFYFK